MRLRHAVKFTVMPLATLPAISEVNLCFPDSAHAAVSNKPTSQKPPFNLFVDLMKNSRDENTFSRDYQGSQHLCKQLRTLCRIFFSFFMTNVSLDLLNMLACTLR